MGGHLLAALHSQTCKDDLYAHIQYNSPPKDRCVIAESTREVYVEKVSGCLVQDLVRLSFMQGP